MKRLFASLLIALVCASSTFTFSCNPKWVWCFQADKSILGKLTASPKASFLLVIGLVSLTEAFD
jgi:hypothetical protein